MPQQAPASQLPSRKKLRYWQQASHKLSQFYASGPVHRARVLQNVRLMEPCACNSPEVVVPGGYAKISDWHERFWVLVVDRLADGSCEGIVCNVLITSQTLQMGQRLRFSAAHVFAVATSKDALHGSSRKRLGDLELSGNIRPVSMQPLHSQWHIDHAAPVMFAPLLQKRLPPLVATAA